MLPPQAICIAVRSKRPSACGTRELITSTPGISVSVGGKALRPSPVNGYTTWQHQRMTYVVVALPRLRRGIYEVELRF